MKPGVWGVEIALDWLLHACMPSLCATGSRNCTPCKSFPIWPISEVDWEPDIALNALKMCTDVPGIALLWKALLHGRRSCNPLDIQRLPFPGDLWFVLVNPVFEAPTAEMRAVLPASVPMVSAIRNCAMGGSLVCTPLSCTSAVRFVSPG